MSPDDPQKSQTMEVARSLEKRGQTDPAVRAAVWQVLQRGVERGELDADVDLAFAYDLLVGPLFMRAVVWGQRLAPDAAEKTADVILAAFAGSTVR